MDIETMTTMEASGLYPFPVWPVHRGEGIESSQQLAMQGSLDEMSRQLKEANATASLELDERRKRWLQFE